MPSLDKDVRNALILSLHRGPCKDPEELKGKQLEQAEDLKEKLLNEGKKLLDAESINELNGLLHKMIIQRDSSYDTIMVTNFDEARQIMIHAGNFEIIPCIRDRKKFC